MRSETKRQSLRPFALERALRCDFGKLCRRQSAGTETTEDVPGITIFLGK